MTKIIAQAASWVINHRITPIPAPASARKSRLGQTANAIFNRQNKNCSHSYRLAYCQPERISRAFGKLGEKSYKAKHCPNKPRCSFWLGLVGKNYL